MLNNIRTLIKIANTELDEKRKELSSLLGRRDELFRQVEAIDSQVQSEIENADKNKDSKSFLQNYIYISRERQKELRSQAENMLPEINKLTDQVREKFTEMKKFETVLENKLEEIEYERLKKDQQELDEISIQRHKISSGSSQ